MSETILFFTENYEGARAEISSLGGIITHKLSKNLFVAQLSNLSDTMYITEAQMDLPSNLTVTERLIARAWRRKHTRPRYEGVMWDASGFDAPRQD